ncbi:MAG: accessory gene regulator ArgB-like protein [Eubacteriaceae bacterium]
MFNWVVSRVIYQLSANNIIEEEDRSIYQYGLESLLTKALHTLTMILVGWFLGLLTETIAFILAYSFVRIYAGGYHAKSKIVCYLWSWGTVLGVLSVLLFYPENSFMALSLVLLLLGFISIYTLAPVENPNKPLDQMEIVVYGKKARTILWILMTLGLILTIGFNSIYGLIIGLCLAFEGLMLVLGKNNY